MKIAFRFIPFTYETISKNEGRFFTDRNGKLEGIDGSGRCQDTELWERRFLCEKTLSVR